MFTLLVLVLLTQSDPASRRIVGSCAQHEVLVNCSTVVELIGSSVS